MDKYELLADDTVTTPGGVTLYRIRALRDVRPGVPTGSIGGYVQSIDNLSLSGSAWVSDQAQVFGSARVSGSAWVSDQAQVFGSAQVSGSAQVFGSARVSGSAWVSGSARVSGSASKTPLHLTGLRWPVTIADDTMAIGCQFHALSQWWRFSDAQIAAMDSDAPEFWAVYRTVLLDLCRGTGRESE